MTEVEESKNKRAGLIVSVAVHALILLVFLFILAWKAPDPPLPEYGIELNFGMDKVGTGDVQPEQPATPTESEEEAVPEEVSEDVVEEQMEDVQPEEQAPEPIQQEVPETTTNTQKSPDVVPKVKEEPKKPVVKEDKKVEKKKEEPTKPVETKKPVEKDNGANGVDGESKTPKNANQGDNLDKTGDKGDPEGTLDARALYGKSGGEGGSSLNMTGWTWDFIPKPNDTSNDNGRIVFQIKIDDRGEILSVTTLERSVSPDIEKIYRAEVEKLTFSKTSDNTIVAPVSTGTITFVIKSK